MLKTERDSFKKVYAHAWNQCASGGCISILRLKENAKLQLQNII